MFGMFSVDKLRNPWRDNGSLQLMALRHFSRKGRSWYADWTSSPKWEKDCAWRVEEMDVSFASVYA